MAETLSLIDKNIINRGNLGGESTESDKSPFRRIEFHLERKPFTGFGNGGGDGTFRLETLNPSSKNTYGNQLNTVGGESSASCKKRDASEMENGLDPELSFGITFRRIGAGLENLGNTCFLNSVLQCLTYTEPLAAYLQSGKHQVTCRKAGFCALCAIQKHVSRALQSSGRSLAPKDLVSNLRCISRTFRNSRQEDAHEYMVNLLESMHKCCLPNGVPSESQSAYDRSLVHKIFGGRLRSQVKCMQCNYCSNKFDPFLDLSLEILKADTLHKAFANFTAKEQLDGGAKQYQCQQCKQKVKALKQLTIHKPPNVLTVHLKRFGSHMSGQKIDKKIHFDSTLDLKPFVTGPYDGDLRYTLYGVLVHAGWSTHSGHYYCFVRTSSGMWYSLDDNRVIQVSEKKVFEQKAYMLFYFKDRKSFPSKKPADVVYQKEKIVINNGARKETQMNNKETHISVASNGNVYKETHISANLSNGSLNSLAPNGFSRQLSNGDHKPIANGGSGLSSDASKLKAITNNGSINGHKSCLVTDGAIRNGFGIIAPEETQKKQKSNLESKDGISSIPSCSKPLVNVEDNVSKTDKEIGGNGQEGVVTASEKSSQLTKMENIIKKEAVGRKKNKKPKKLFKCKAIGMKFTSNLLMGTSINQRKKKKQKQNKRIKNQLPSPSKAAVENDKDVAELATSNSNGVISAESNGSNRSTQKDFVRMLTSGLVDRTVPRWDEDESTSSQIRETTRVNTIGYVGDEWDEEYDRGKKRKIRISKTEFDGKNPFQDIANQRLKEKQEVSKRPFSMMKKNKESQYGNGPFRI